MPSRHEAKGCVRTLTRVFGRRRSLPSSPQVWHLLRVEPPDDLLHLFLHYCKSNQVFTLSNYPQGSRLRLSWLLTERQGKKQTDGTQRTPTTAPGFLPSDSVNQVLGEFSGFRGASCRCPPRLACNSPTTSMFGCNLRRAVQLGST